MATVWCRLKLYESTVSGLTATTLLAVLCLVKASAGFFIGEGVEIWTILKQYIFLRHKFKT